MSLRPIGHRVLVKPDAPVEQTAGGLHLPEAYADLPAMSGIVQAVGAGAERDQKIRSSTIARCLNIVDDLAIDGEGRHELRKALNRYRSQIEDLGHVCAVGDRVVFPLEAGHEIILNEATQDAVIVLSEDQIIAVYETAGVAA